MRVSETLVAALVAVTVAPGITAPELSVTVPVMAPSPAVCAFNVGGIVRKANSVRRVSTVKTDFVDVTADTRAR